MYTKTKRCVHLINLTKRLKLKFFLCRRVVINLILCLKFRADIGMMGYVISG